MGAFGFLLVLFLLCFSSEAVVSAVKCGGVVFTAGVAVRNPIQLKREYNELQPRLTGVHTSSTSLAYHTFCSMSDWSSASPPPSSSSTACSPHTPDIGGSSPYLAHTLATTSVMSTEGGGAVESIRSKARRTIAEARQGLQALRTQVDELGLAFLNKKTAMGQPMAAMQAASMLATTLEQQIGGVKARTDAVKASLSAKWRRKVHFDSLPTPTSAWSPSRSTPPCPVWIRALSNTTCVDMARHSLTDDVCAGALPSLPRSYTSADSVLPTSTSVNTSSVYRMYCADKGGVYPPPADALCSDLAYSSTAESPSSCSACALSYFGPNCDPCPDCGSHGQCSDGMEGNGTCICEADYYGSSCDPCPDCGSDGHCNDGAGGDGSCECNEGFFGASCDPCPDCGAHGQCNDGVGGDGSCICEGGYFGATCDPCPDCGSYGQCNDGAGGNGSCICDGGWEGEVCDCLTGSHMISCLSVASVWRDVAQTPVKLVDPGGSSGDELGFGGPSLSSSGLILAVAAHLDGGKGSLLVWERKNVSTSFASVTPAKLVDPDGSSGDALGESGATASDLVVAAGSHADNSNQGSVSVWARTDTSTSFADVTAVKLTDPDGEGGDELGQGCPSVSNNGLVLAAGAPGDDYSTGAVLVWDRATTSTSFSSVTPVKLVDPNGGTSNGLGGGGVTLSANGLILAASSYGDDVKGGFSGSVLVWERSALSTSFGDVTPVKLVDPAGQGYDYLGQGGVSLSDDGLVLAVGAHGDDDVGPTSGSLLVWDRSDTSTSFGSVTPVKLLDPFGNDYDYFGEGGVTLSGSGLVVAAATKAEDLSRGAVAVWERASTSTSFSSITPKLLTDPDGAVNDNLGEGGPSVSASGFVLAAASHEDEDNGASSGSVTVWEGICKDGYAPPLCTTLPIT